MTVSAADIAAKKSEILAKQMTLTLAQNAARKAVQDAQVTGQAAVAAAQSALLQSQNDMQVLALQKQIDDQAAADAAAG